MVSVELREILKILGDFRLEIESLKAKEGEFLTLLGPSGCGKTTTLRIIAGFEKPDRGEVLFNGKVMNEIPPYERNIGIVFQDYALFPHMTVFKNIAFGLELRKLPREEIEKKVRWALKLVGLEGFENRYPEQLSGGQQQRVSLARVLSKRPKIIFADEPTGNLDKETATLVMSVLLEYTKEHNAGLLLVTHDEEMASMCSKSYELRDRVLK